MSRELISVFAPKTHALKIAAGEKLPSAKPKLGRRRAMADFSFEVFDEFDAGLIAPLRCGT